MRGVKSDDHEIGEWMDSPCCWRCVWVCTLLMVANVDEWMDGCVVCYFFRCSGGRSVVAVRVRVRARMIYGGESGYVW